MRYANNAWKDTAVVLCALSVIGCNTVPTRDPDFASVRPRPLPPPAATSGAIYQAGYEMVLFEDLRARQVGDILTIKLVEKTDASKKAETTIEKQTETSITNPTVLGSALQFNTPKILPLASHSDNNLAASLSSSNDFEGEGKSSQSNSLKGDITVSVAEVLPNGNLVVQGEKLLTLNRGHEHVRLSGIVRTADIDADNSVLSTKVADARIIYGGEGEVADANVIGWLARFFVGIFFPF